MKTMIQPEYKIPVSRNARHLLVHPECFNVNLRDLNRQRRLEIVLAAMQQGHDFAEIAKHCGITKQALAAWCHYNKVMTNPIAAVWAEQQNAKRTGKGRNRVAKIKNMPDPATFPKLNIAPLWEMDGSIPRADENELETAHTEHTEAIEEANTLRGMILSGLRKNGKITRKDMEAYKRAIRIATGKRQIYMALKKECETKYCN